MSQALLQPTRLPVSSPGNRAFDALPLPAPSGRFEIATSESCFQARRPFPLIHGGELATLRLAYQLSGPAGAPLVVALGGISANRHVVATDHDPSPGWWDALVGPGRAVDPRRVRVLSFDYLGGNGDSSASRLATGETTATWPALAPCDQGRALALLLDHLGEPRIDLLLGASYGGMVALAFAADYPELLGRVLAISAADRPHPRSTAWRVVQRRIVELAGRSGDWAEGLALARALAMTTYRSAEELAERFGGGPGRTAEGTFRFPVEGYLEAQGERFARTFDPLAFLCLSQSIDLHRVDPARIAAPVTLVAVCSDELVPLDQLRRLAAELGGRAELVEIASRYGHDAFLKERATVGAVVRRVLATVEATVEPTAPTAVLQGGLV